MKGELTRGRRTNYVRVDHAVIGSGARWCPTCCDEIVYCILEPGNLIMCSLCNEVSTK